MDKATKFMSEKRNLYGQEENFHFLVEVAEQTYHQLDMKV